MSTRLDPSVAVSATRCASPPLSVRSGRSKRDIADADIDQVRAVVAATSSTSGRAIGRCHSAQFQRLQRSADASRIFIRTTSAKFLPPTRTASASGRSRAPPQAGHGIVRSPAAQEHPQVHLVLPPLQPAEEALQAAEVALRHAFVDDPPARPRSTRDTARRPADYNRRPAPAVLRARARTTASSTARSPPRESTSTDRARRGPCRSPRCCQTLRTPGQAPSGRLKLNSCGSGSGYSMPHVSQRSRAAKRNRARYDRPSIADRTPRRSATSATHDRIAPLRTPFPANRGAARSTTRPPSSRSTTIVTRLAIFNLDASAGVKRLRSGLRPPPARTLARPDPRPIRPRPFLVGASTSNPSISRVPSGSSPGLPPHFPANRVARSGRSDNKSLRRRGRTARSGSRSLRSWCRRSPGSSGSGLLCVTAIAGGMPSIRSASGLSSCSRNCRVYAEKLSMYRRCPSA